jgi:hypothetical protein
MASLADFPYALFLSKVACEEISILSSAKAIEEPYAGHIILPQIVS